MGIASLNKFLSFLIAKGNTREQGFEANLNGCYGCFQLVVDVVRQLAFKTVSFLLCFVAIDTLDILAKFASGKVCHNAHYKCN